MSKKAPSSSLRFGERVYWHLHLYLCLVGSVISKHNLVEATGTVSVKSVQPHDWPSHLGLGGYAAAKVPVGTPTHLKGLGPHVPVFTFVLAFAVQVATS